MFFDGCTDAVWLRMSIRIGTMASAVLDAVSGKGKADLSVVAGDMFDPMSAYLVREMGFPVGEILCCCNENCGFWELLHHGELRTDRCAVLTGIPAADIAVPDGLECVIALCCGRDEVKNYLEAVRAGRPYVPGAEELALLRSLFRSAVVTRSGRIRGPYLAPGVPADPCTALALAGLMDYRAGHGLVRPGLVIPQ